VAYRIQLAASAARHLDHLTARQQVVVLNAINLQLQHEPFQETRNRKRLRPNPLAPWELRVGTVRVFYEADAETEHLVNVLAIGVKKGNRLLIGDKEIRL
jgi:mRNA-degrading endonuclease RelE of RelBE toxin-antitoxin system